MTGLYHIVCQPEGKALTWGGHEWGTSCWCKPEIGFEEDNILIVHTCYCAGCTRIAIEA